MGGKDSLGCVCLQEVDALVQAPLVALGIGAHIHMVLGITQETSQTSSQNPRQTPTQAFSPEGPTSGDAGQSKLFPAEEEEEDDGDDCSQIRPPCGCPVMTQ